MAAIVLRESFRLLGVKAAFAASVKSKPPVIKGQPIPMRMGGKGLVINHRT